MKTIDEQIEYMKAEVVEWSGIPDSGMGFPEDIEFRQSILDSLDSCQSILATLEKVKAGQNETPGSR